VSSATLVDAVQCVVCGRAVQLDRRRSYRRKTCSRECHRALIGLSNQRKKRSQRHIAKIKAGIATSPLTGPYETNRNAKDWHLIDPTGREHRFRNLSLFIRSHPELFGPDDLSPRGRDGNAPCRAAVGLANLRPDRKKQAAGWKQWRWGEPVAPRRPRSPNPQTTSWALRAPDGAEFYFTNFAAFAREHANRFRPDDLAQYGNKVGLCRARLCLGALRPKANRRHRSWRGWTWIE
jgi:predicted nucleic acid-binding Zn ribbon protein